MRRIIFFILLIVQCVCYAQKGVRPISIEMNELKYLFIKFPCEINYADMGSYDLKAEKCLGKILKIRAVKPDFSKTNLSVVTIDGKYYSFIVEYSTKPSFIAVDMTNVAGSIASKDIIPSTNIEISDIHTTHIILPTKVSDITLGSNEVISEKAEEIDNIVKVKSVIRDQSKFKETSITVVTADGKIFPMTVGYAKNPKDMSISFVDGSNALFNDMNVDDGNMRRISEWIISKGQYINDLGIQDSKMTYQLCSVFTDQDILAFYLHVKNNSKIDYPIDFVKAYIGDGKGAKHLVSQDEELYPIYTYYSDNDNVIHGKEGMDIVFFFKKFTMPKYRALYFELYEENGGRNMKFSAPNKVIINAEVMERIKKD